MKRSNFKNNNKDFFFLLDFLFKMCTYLWAARFNSCYFLFELQKFPPQKWLVQYNYSYSKKLKKSMHVLLYIHIAYKFVMTRLYKHPLCSDLKHYLIFNYKIYICYLWKTFRLLTNITYFYFWNAIKCTLIYK